ncbi:Lipid A core - O-antigen ligase [Gammaproteobacteria bacterium MOLA455]|nr:Lipid A core - O-antigen ligase [Gammaproteobacteria bacterium MOLA455]
MPEYLRAYIVVLLLFFISFWFVNKIRPDFISRIELKTWRNYWILITSIAFLSPNIWVYIAALALLLISVRLPPSDKTIFFLVILCASPLFHYTIPGFGVINFLITLNYTDTLVLFLLLPAYMAVQKERNWSLNNFDKCVIAYVALISMLALAQTSITHGIRLAFNYSLAIALPYLVFSRVIKHTKTLQKMSFALLFCLIPMALVGCFESLKYWKLYSSAFAHVLGDGNYLSYRLRGDSLRANALYASPIVLGYAMVIGLGFLIYIKKYVTNKNIIRFIGLIFLASLYFTKARGPWLGLAVLGFLYIWSGPHKFSNLVRLALLTSLLAIPLSLTPAGNKFFDMLPFLSSEESHETSTVDYRFRLLEQGWLVLKKSPILGSINYRDTPEMEVMRQGQGIIDVVNSYIHITLSYGLTGLSLFLFIFIGLLFSLQKTIKSLPSTEAELVHIGRVLFAVMGAMIFIIFTVSSIDFIPYFYWSIAGICSAYLKICRNRQVDLHKKFVSSPLP